MMIAGCMAVPALARGCVVFASHCWMIVQLVPDHEPACVLPCVCAYVATCLPRFALHDEDVVPFMDVLGATKGLTGLLTDSSSWLEQLLQVQTIKQLHEFAASTLPALAKLYPRNTRVQSLLKSIYASMQGQLVELKDDTYAPSYATSAAGDVPAAVLTPTGADGQQRQRSLQRQSGPIAEGFEGLKGRFGSKRLSRKASQQQEQQQHDGAGEDTELEAAAAEEQEVMAAAAAVAAAISSGAANAAVKHASSAGSSLQAQQGEPAAGGAYVDAEASSISAVAAAAEAGAAADEGGELQGINGSAAALAAYAAATAAATSSQPVTGKKMKFGKSFMKSIVSTKSKGKPEPSPDPELCSAPAALAAHAELEAMLSEAEAEVAASEEAAAAAAAAAAKAMQDSSSGCGSSHSSALGLSEPREQQSSSRSALQLGLKGLQLQIGDEESSFSRAGEEGIDTSGFSSMCSLSMAFQRPPDLPWEVSPQEGAAAAAAASSAGDGTSGNSPRSVAAAAAQFESRIAQQTSRRTSRLSSNQAVVGVGAATPLPASPRLLAGEELDLVDGTEFELAEASSDGALGPVPSSPRSARRFHFFKFRSILQHHEKLSTQALADAAAAAAALEAAAAKEGDGEAAASGTSARIRAVLSMRRRTAAASAVSAAGAAADGADAADAEEAAAHAADLASGPAAAWEAGAASASALPGASPRGSQVGEAYDAADVPASTHGAADVADQPSKQGRIGGLMSRAASRMMSLSSRASREPAAAAARGTGEAGACQCRLGI